MSNKSESIAKLAAALSKVQESMAPAEKLKVNPFFKSKYADLSAIWDVVKQPLIDNGFSVIQTTDFDATTFFVETTLAHISGEWISGRYVVKPSKDDPQSLGSAVTYARRYSLAAIVGVVTADEDDDGNAASDRDSKTSQPKNLNHGGTHKAVRVLPEKMSPNEIPLSQRDNYEQHVSPGPIVADENPHFYVIEGLQGCDPKVAGKAIAEIPVKKLEASLKPKFAAFTTDRDKVNIAAYLKSLEEQTRKQPTAKEKIEAEREKLSQEPLPDFSSDINF